MPPSKRTKRGARTPHVPQKRVCRGCGKDLPATGYMHTERDEKGVWTQACAPCRSREIAKAGDDA